VFSLGHGWSGAVDQQSHSTPRWRLLSTRKYRDKGDDHADDGVAHVIFSFESWPSAGARPTIAKIEFDASAD
jgi:hypothetical protein